MDRPNMDAWVGRETKDYSCITEFQARKIHATVGEGDTPVTGTALPPLWHWCAFTPDENNAAVGRDGHIRGSELLPPIHLPRRMWAGGHLTFHRPLHVGENLERTTRLKSVSEKHGKSGPLILITLEHTIYGAHGLAIEERQDIVHLKIPETFAPPPKSELPVTPFESIETPEILLFRYSAITFNAHRIHYDVTYAREIEHYPGLIVHGPLQAKYLMRAAIRHKGRIPYQFGFRGVHPMFAGAPCQVALREDDTGVSLWTGQDGHQCMQAHAIWEGTQ